MVVEDDETGVEVAVPDVPARVEGCGHGICEDHGAVFEKIPWDEGDGGEVLLIEAEGYDEKGAEDKETNDERGLPGVGLVRVDVECEEEEGEAKREDQDTDHVELFSVVFDVLDEGAAMLTGGHETLLDSFILVGPEEPDEWRSDKGYEDCEDAETPSVAYAAGLDNGVDGEAINPRGDKPR